MFVFLFDIDLIKKYPNLGFQVAKKIRLSYAFLIEVSI